MFVVVSPFGRNTNEEHLDMGVTYDVVEAFMLPARLDYLVNLNGVLVGTFVRLLERRFVPAWFMHDYAYDTPIHRTFLQSSVV